MTTWSEFEETVEGLVNEVIEDAQKLAAFLEGRVESEEDKTSVVVAPLKEAEKIEPR